MTDFVKLDAYLEKHLDESIAELSAWSPSPASAPRTGAWRMRRAGGRDAAPARFCRSGAAHRRRAGGLCRAQRAQPQNPAVLQPLRRPAARAAGAVGQPALRAGAARWQAVRARRQRRQRPFVSRLFAIDALLATEGELPCNVKFIIEGEEEISSVHLHRVCRSSTRSCWRPMPASGSSAAWITAKCRCSTWACAASAMWS